MMSVTAISHLCRGRRTVPTKVRRRRMVPPAGQVSRRTSARANSCGSNGRRSSRPSPTPTSFTGRPSSYAIATATPPLAEPSSFVSATPVTPAASPNSRACWSPFWPVVASTTRSVSCGAPSIRPSITRRTLASSSIRFDCVCRRPAVSMMTTSRPRARPASTASKATAAGSPPRGCADEIRAGALGPDLELLLGGRAEGVARADEDACARARGASARACRRSSSCRCR